MVGKIKKREKKEGKFETTRPTWKNTANSMVALAWPDSEPMKFTSIFRVHSAQPLNFEKL